MREMAGPGENQGEKLGLKRISCASQLTIPETSGTSPYVVYNQPDTRCPEPNQETRILDIS